LSRQIERAARIRVLVRPAERQEQCRRAGMPLFQRLGREPRIVAAELVKLSGQCGVVASVAKHDPANFARGIRNLQHRRPMIHRTVGIDRSPPIDGESGGAFAELDRRGREVAQRGTGDRHQRIRQHVPVVDQLLLLAGRQHGKIAQIGPHDGSCVGMARVQQKLGTIHAVLFLQLCRDFIGEFARDSHQVGRDDHIRPPGELSIARALAHSRLRTPSEGCVRAA
jgi:hypothetical protein